MDFRFTPEQERLRQEIRDWLAEVLPPDYVPSLTPISEDDWEFARAFNKKLAQRGWIAPAWPKEYGGLGASYVEQAIFNEELAYHRAPNGSRIFGVGMIGPTLIKYGTEEQKRRFLPGITSGEVLWCQGYSEPGAGSDLAALQTRAVRDGDEYVLNGQKIWTTNAHVADWMFLLARTDPEAPRHKGITFFLVDMKTPGITVQPIINLAGKHDFNQVFFDNVRVPADQVVGKPNEGWYVAMALLDFERSSIGAVASVRRAWEDLACYLRDSGRLSGPQGQILRLGLAQLRIEQEVARLMAYKIAAAQDRGEVQSYEASMIKVFATELEQRLYNFAVNALGLPGQLVGGLGAPFDGRIPLNYLWNVAPTIYSGSNEIQRNIIAQRGLGLPR